MCGIFGLVTPTNVDLSIDEIRRATKYLFKLSETRGKEACGVAVSSDHKISILKSNMPASNMIKTNEFMKVFTQDKKCGVHGPIAVMGHSRMITNGSAENNENNQPIVKNGSVTVHNGIIVNEAKLLETFPSIDKKFDVDTEIIPSLIKFFLDAKCNIGDAVKKTFDRIEGVASIGTMFDGFDNLIMATNNGSLFWVINKQTGVVIFASERFILKEFLNKFQWADHQKVKQLLPNTALINDIVTGRTTLVDFKSPKTKFLASTSKSERIIEHVPLEGGRPAIKIANITSDNHKLERLLEDNAKRIDLIKRCVRCLLPETFPFISFDGKGVCSICNTYQPIKYDGEEALEALVKPHRRHDKNPDCIVALSGGRDSTFVLHYVKSHLNLNPVAYTYDWGMITDQARRNISRVCSKLGVEHILISADIRKKRENIRKNVNAWLTRPHLGLVPLFMAGDKQFFYYSHKLKKQLDLDLAFFGFNTLERTDFKVGFCNIFEKKKEKLHFHLSAIHKMQMLAFYLKQYALNPRYFNSSVLDTMAAFLSYYGIKHDYHTFYESFPWNEKAITDTILGEYDWEGAEDTTSTWRTGDGTASFYNYIYFTVAGFTENDTFRSNLIRNGIMSRDDALKKTRIDNQPRYESIKWYCDTNDIDFEHAIKTINKIPKLYS